MNEQIPVGGLNMGEKVLRHETPSIWSPPFITGYIGGIVFAIFFLLLAPFSMIFVLLSLFGLLTILLTEMYRQGHHYYITNQRCIKEVTFISRISEEATYDLISNVTFTQTLAARLFNYGNIICQMASGDSFLFIGVKNPSSFKSAIISAKQAFLEKPRRVMVVRDETKPDEKILNYCPECGVKLEGRPRYCPNCGSRLK